MRQTLSRWLILLLIPLTMLAVVSPAWAQDDRGRAIQLITDANGDYERGEFRDALRKYRSAYEITDDPRVLYRIGLTYENLANYQRAREHLELFLLAEPSTKYRDRVEKKIATLSEQEAALQAAIQVESDPPGAEVYLYDDTGRPSGVTPIRLPVGPGTHLLIVKKEGHEAAREEVTVEPAATVERKYELGGGVAAEEPEELEAENQHEEKLPVADPVPHDPRVVTMVRLKPSTGVSFLMWTLVGVGWVAAIVGAAVASANPFARDAGYATLAAGVGGIGIGGYFLWFHDWNKNLRRAAPTASGHAPAIAPAYGASVGLKF